jgi:hypothetical protein
VRNHVLGITDPTISPVSLGWHFGSFDLMSELCLYLPLGKYNKNELSVGVDHWTIAPKLGGTVYFDSAKQWALSALFSYEYNLENSELDLDVGNHLNLQYSFSKSFDLVTLSLSGYATWQLEEDSGSAATSAKDRVYAVGPEIEMIVPPISTIVRVRYMQEFEAKNRGANNIFRIAASWAF